MSRRDGRVHSFTRDLRQQLAKELQVKPDQLLDVLRSMNPRSAHLSDALEHLEEAARAHRSRLRWVNLGR